MKMLKKNRFVKQLFALFLAFTMMVTMLPAAYADEIEETTPTETVETTETVEATEVVEATETVEATPAATSETDQYGIAVAAADVNAPIVSDFVFTENGQEVSDGYLHVTFTAQDADGSAISSNNSYVYLETVDGTYHMNLNNITLVSGNTYSAEIYRPGVGGTINFTTIKIGDTAGNVATVPAKDASGNYLYSFTEIITVAPEEIDYTVTEITLDNTAVKLDDNNMSVAMNVTVKVAEEVQMHNYYDETINPVILVQFERDNSNGYVNDGHTWMEMIRCEYDKASNTFKGSTKVEPHQSSGTYKLRDVWSWYGENITYDNVNPTFTVEKNFTDTTAPVVTELYLTKNGKKMEPGETVARTDEVKVYITFDDNELYTHESIGTKYVNFYTSAPNISSNGKAVQFEWNDSIKKFEATLDLTDWYPTEWSINYIQAADKYYNQLQNYSYTYGLNTFYIVEDGTCVIPTYDVTAYFYTGNASVNKTATVSGKITTLNEMFSDGLPEAKQFEGANFLGWGRWDYLKQEYVLIDPDEKIAIESWMSFQPVYDKTPVTVTLEYASVNGGEYKEIPFVVEPGTTYNELAELFKNYTVAHFPGLKFEGWDLHLWNSDMLDEPVSVNSYVQLVANYSNCFVGIGLNYYDAANESEYDFQGFAVEEGTKLGDVLALVNYNLGHSATYGFTGWDVTEEMKSTVISGNMNFYDIVAEYAYYPVDYSYTYMAKDGSTKTVETSVVVPAGTTFNDVVKTIVLPSDAAESSGGWDVSELYPYELETIADTEFQFYFDNFEIAKEYDGYIPIAISNRYVSPELDVESTCKFVYIKDTYTDGFTYQDIYELRDKISGLAMELSWNTHEQFKPKEIFVEHFIEDSYKENSVYSGAVTFYTYASCDKVLAMVTYPDEVEQSLILDDGAEYQLLSNYRGYDVTWEGYAFMSGNIQFTKDFKFVAEAPWVSLYASLVDPSVVLTPPVEETPVAPAPAPAPAPEQTKPAQKPATNTETPAETPTETPTERPVVVMREEVVAQKVTEIESAEAGSTLVFDMRQADGTVATVVPVKVLEAARGKDVNIVLDMGGYKWTINGMDILDIDLADINLEVTMDTEAVAPSLVNKLAGGDPTRQISLTHNGDFGFKASLTLNVGNEYEGQYGNLYYHDSTGKLVFMNAGEIDADGNVSLEFSHASDYVIVIGRDRTEEEAAKAETPEVPSTEEPSEETATGANTNTGSGNGAMIIVVVLVVVIVAAAVVLVAKKKKGNE